VAVIAVTISLPFPSLVCYALALESRKFANTWRNPVSILTSSVTLKHDFNIFQLISAVLQNQQYQH